MFDSLRRWFPAANLASGGEVPLAATIESMTAGGVRLGLVCAWWGPRGPLIDNDEVAAFVAAYPGGVFRFASGRPSRTMFAIHELRRAVRELGFRGLRILP